jgi:UDP-N-acetyl-D-mannosaminuronate dehydrogenase
MTVGILGLGEVGSALSSLYKEKGVTVIAKDLNKECKFEKNKILNICIPYTESFIKIVSDEIKNSNPKLTIIHSTVPIGTTKKIQEYTNKNVVHSPVVGSHPFLKKSFKKFIKYVGSNNLKSLKLAEKHYSKLKIKIKKIKNSEFTEMAKLFCTSYYGLCIAWHHYMYNVCKQNNIDFSLIKEWNKNYNKGYKKTRYVRPVLDPPENGKIGGHCIIPNAILLNKQYPDDILHQILKLNENSFCYNS